MFIEYIHPFIKVLSYPDVGLKESAKMIVEMSGKDCEFVNESVGLFLDNIGDKDTERLREIYTTTFDLKATACMDVGYVLFGEDYKRGAFLVQIQRLQREYGVEIGSELPDHLPNMLKLIEALPDGEERKELIEKILLPFFKKILANFERTEGAVNPYEYPLQALKVLTEREFKMNESVLKGAY